jgi:D-proline reductase (dithiol) PrdB
VGLVAREIERQGIATVSISIQRELTEKTRPPRAVFLRWPYGHPLGEPFNVAQQRWILLDAFRALTEVQTPGTIQDLPYLWRRPGPWEEKKLSDVSDQRSVGEYVLPKAKN